MRRFQRNLVLAKMSPRLILALLRRVSLPTRHGATFRGYRVSMPKRQCRFAGCRKHKAVCVSPKLNLRQPVADVVAWLAVAAVCRLSRRFRD